MAEESTSKDLSTERLLPDSAANATPPPGAVDTAGAEVVQAAPAAVRRSMPMALSISLGLLLAAAMGLFFYKLTWFILILYLSFIAATILEAPVQLLRKAGIRRGFASVIVMVGGLVILGFILYFVANGVYSQIGAVSKNLDAAPQRINAWVNHFRQAHPAFGRRMPDFDITKSMAGAVPSVSALLSNAMSGIEIVTWLVIMFFMVLYMLVDGADHLKAIRTLLPKQRRLEATRVFNAIAKAHRGWALASLCNVASSATLSSIGLSLIGIPGAILLGLLAGLGEMIPNIGPLICAAPALLFTLVAEPDKFLWVAGMFVVVWTIQGYTITPLMMKFSIELPVLVTIIAVLVFGTLFGFLGIFVSIPLVADMVVLWRFHEAHWEKDLTDYDAVNDPPLRRRTPVSPDDSPSARFRKFLGRARRRNPAEPPSPSLHQPSPERPTPIEQHQNR